MHTAPAAGEAVAAANCWVQAAASPERMAPWLLLQTCSVATGWMPAGGRASSREAVGILAEDLATQAVAVVPVVEEVVAVVAGGDSAAAVATVVAAVAWAVAVVARVAVAVGREESCPCSSHAAPLAASTRRVR